MGQSFIDELLLQVALALSVSMLEGVPGIEDLPCSFCKSLLAFASCSSCTFMFADLGVSWRLSSSLQTCGTTQKSISEATLLSAKRRRKGRPKGLEKDLM